MNRLLRILGIFLLGILVLAGVAFGLLLLKGRALNAESKAYVDETVPAIVKTWSQEELLAHAAPQFAVRFQAAEAQRGFGQMSRLGGLTRYIGSRGSANITFGKWNYAIVAQYQAECEFEHGAGIVELDIVKDHGTW